MINNNDKDFQQKRLWNASEVGDCGEIRRSVINGADLDMLDENGRMAFQIASQNQKIDAMKTILAAKEMLDHERMGIVNSKVSSLDEESMHDRENTVLEKMGRKSFGKKSA